jgi:hypothetical protein
MTASEIYRRYAAECLRMSACRPIEDKAALVQMATMWVRLAEIAESALKVGGETGGTDESPPDS